MTAQILSIGTEITTGEIVNSNAAWISRHLEDLSVRVHSHITVRDQREEILTALHWTKSSPMVIVTGGLGPTSDDITRDCLAIYSGAPLEFDEQVWVALQDFYQEKGLPLRPAHKQQCYFPTGSERLKNPVGTALGFMVKKDHQHIFVLPGPPREMEGIWNLEVEKRVKAIVPAGASQWLFWTCMGAPESEVAEVAEEAMSGSSLELGYRAQVPYVRVKLYADQIKDTAWIKKLEDALRPWTVARGDMDLAKEVMRLWPAKNLKVVDTVCEGVLYQRLLSAKSDHKIEFHSSGELDGDGLEVQSEGELFYVNVRLDGQTYSETKSLPYKLSLSSERGRRSAAEWVLWLTHKHLKARISHS